VERVRYLENDAMSTVWREICRAQEDGGVKNDRARRLSGSGGRRRLGGRLPHRRDNRWAASNRPAKSRFGVVSLPSDDDEEDQRGKRRQTKTRIDGGEGSLSPDAPSPVLEVLGGEAGASGLCVGERPV
jgi:hypothetical protein